jgi:SET domain
MGRKRLYETTAEKKAARSAYFKRWKIDKPDSYQQHVHKTNLRQKLDRQNRQSNTNVADSSKVVRVRKHTPSRCDKTPVVHFPGASQCEFCAETCGPDGCSSRCICFATRRICKHNNPYYFCAAMPHRHKYPSIKVTTEKFLKNGKRVSVDGLRVTEDVKSGSIIGEYTGDIISKKNEKLINKRLKAQERYVMVAGDVYIDGSKGNEMRFINASCKPNVEFQAWLTQKDTTRIFVVANKDLKARKMAHTTYGWCTGERPIFIKCECGLTRECRTTTKYL